MSGPTDRAIRPDQVIAPGDAIRLPVVREGIALLPNLVKLLARLMLDRRVPRMPKAVLLMTVGYVLSPVDVFPDIIPFFGALDDLLVVSLGLHYLLRSVGPAIVLEHWDGSENVLDLITSVTELGASLVPRPIRRVMERLVAL